MTIKQERASHLIQEILSELLMTEVTDPALQSITVTEVKVDREIEYAEVFIHSLDEKKEVMAGLNRSNGFLNFGKALLPMLFEIFISIMEKRLQLLLRLIQNFESQLSHYLILLLSMLRRI